MRAINMPEYPGEAGVSTILNEENRIVFAWIRHNESPENPLEDWDCIGSIHSLGHRLISYDPDTIEENRDNPDAIPLSYFEHGLCMWGVAGTMDGMPDFRWDGVDFAGIWLPDECILDEAKGMVGDFRRSFMKKRADHACRAYTHWCNGDIWCVELRVYQLDWYDDDTPIQSLQYYEDSPDEVLLFEDVCCGFYGWEEAEINLKDSWESYAR